MVLAVLGSCRLAPAAIRVNLITRLNQIMDDADTRKMSAANKYAILDQVGREYGRRGLIIHRDTVITSVDAESYTFNSDFAGGLQAAYTKHGPMRKGLVITDRDSAFRAVQVDEGVLTYAFVDQDGRLGLHSIPKRADTVILLYFAFSTPLVSDSTEWEVPDAYEDAALYDVAARALFKIGTSESQGKSARAGFVADSLLSELRNPVPQTRSVETINK
jgi:hypothetical protein